MRATPHRIALVENRSLPVLAEAAAELGQTRQEIAALLGETSRRLRKLQRLDAEPIIIDGDHVKVVELAGLIRVEAGLELEVAPKFLGQSRGWREDFFRIASLSQNGRILPHEGVVSGFGMDFELEEAPAPGFVLRTWPAWEDLLFLAMRTGLRGDKVEA